MALQLHEKRQKDGHLGITLAVAEATVDEGIAILSDRLIAFLESYAGELRSVLAAPGFVDAELDIGHFASTEYAAWSVTLPAALLQKLATFPLDVTVTTFPSDPKA
ncbi:hypothetical protein [Aestuariivirga sp.]|uniref:hypothetical protein n=1 Tax=Aestuariivirga sp. TaxID=2650926 RepID=UPI0039E2EEDA